MSWEIELTEEEVDLCRNYATQRSKPKRDHQVRNRKVDQNRSDFDTDFLGLRGELAFAKKFNLELHQLKETMLCGDGGHKDYDFLGSSLSIKTRGSNPANCRYVMPEYLFPPKADYMVCIAEVTTEKLRLHGWCTRQEFIEHYFHTDLGHGPTVGIYEEHLHTMETFTANFPVNCESAPST